MYRREEGREEGQREGTGARQGLGKERERAVVEEGLAKGGRQSSGFLGSLRYEVRRKAALCDECGTVGQRTP